jgi:hypothetical protein
MSRAGDVLKALKGFHSAGKDEYEACCPAHKDDKASLSIKLEPGGKILLDCKAGCDTESVIKKLGLKWSDLFPENNNGNKPQSNIVATYDYRNAAGDLVYQVVRMDPKDFRQRRQDGQGGWIWSTKGIPRIPYNLPELAGAEYIFEVEGEKDVENLRKIGLTATCNAGGAGKWTAELNQYFNSNQHITILPDNDEPGQKHAELVAKNLHGIVASVKVLDLEGLPEKGDVSDWLIGRDPGTAAEELARLSDAAPEWNPEEIEKKESSITGSVRELIDSIEGVFTTGQIYRDLGAASVQEKAAIRQAIVRLKGSKIQPTGTQAGQWRIIRGDVAEMNFDAPPQEPLELWLPFDLHNYVEIMPGNIIVITGDADAGKTAVLLNIIKRNIAKWQCHYFNSEMGTEELRKRLMLFPDFPMRNPRFHAYERTFDFQDVIQPGRYSLNIIDYLEIVDDFFKVSGYLNQIHRALGESIAIVAIQKKNRNSPMPLGAERTLEKPRLVISLSLGNRSKPNQAEILKCKNRKVEHSMIGKIRTYKLIKGSEIRAEGPEWITL